MSKSLTVRGQQPEENSTSMELKQILEVAGTASLLSLQNMKVLGDPGSGKTSILHFMARQIFGGEYEEGGHYLKIECSPSLRPERIAGHENPLYMLTEESKRGKMEKWVFDKTPRDPVVWHVVLNELPRIGDIARDTLLPIMDTDLNVYHPVTFWADGNTAMSAPSAWALNDRFSLNIWYVAPVVDVHGIMKHGKPANWKYDVPDLKAIKQVREWLADWMQKGYDTQAYWCIQQAIDTILGALPGTEFVVNNRRISQWIGVLYAMGAYYAGAPEFNTLPTEAYEAWSYCYPTESQLQSLKFRSIVMKGVDPLGTKIAEFEQQAVEHFNALYNDINSQTRNGAERQQRLEREVGVKLAQYQKQLRSEFHDDARAKAAINRLTAAYRQMQNGTFGRG